MAEGPAFYVYEDQANEWRWGLVAGNHEIFGDSGEGYNSHQGCLAAVARVRQLVQKPGAARPR